MSVREQAVLYGNGSINVRDHGGEGPHVLLVHSPGYCAASWDGVAAALGGRVRAYALDLPGHGGSTSTVRRTDDVWRSVIAVAEELELSDALLVGLSQGSHACLVASLEARDMFSGVVTVGGSCVRTREQASDDVTFYTSDQFRDLLEHRFFFGRRGNTDREARILMDHMVARLATDWRVVGFKGLREETQYSIRPDPDGEGWIHLPTAETITKCISLAPDHRYFPDERLYRRIDVPVVIVQLSEGLDQEHAERERHLARTNHLVSVRELDSGEYPHYTRRHEVAGIILETCGVKPRPFVVPDDHTGSPY